MLILRCREVACDCASERQVSGILCISLVGDA